MLINVLLGIFWCLILAIILGLYDEWQMQRRLEKQGYRIWDGD